MMPFFTIVTGNAVTIFRFRDLQAGQKYGICWEGGKAAGEGRRVSETRLIARS